MALEPDAGRPEAAGASGAAVCRYSGRRAGGCGAPAAGSALPG